MNKPKSLPERWVSFVSESEPTLYAVAIATQLAARTEATGTVRVGLGALETLVRTWHGSKDRKVTAAGVVLSLVETGWLSPVDVDQMIFRLSIPSDLGPVPVPTEYVPADAVKRPVGRKRWMKPQRVKA